MRTLLMLLAVGGAVGLAGCSSGSSSQTPSTSSTTTTSTQTTTPASTTTPSSTQAGTTPATENLVISNNIRAQLLAAGAALHQLPVSDYTGLRAGETYYAYDSTTATYWAGAGLVASASSIRAQVGDQDDGAYLVFKRPSGGSWQAYNAGIPGSTAFVCGVKPPASVIAVWHWAPGSCHPGG